MSADALTPPVDVDATAVTPSTPIRPLREAVAGALVVFVVSALGLGVTYYFARQAQIEAVQRKLMQVARFAATAIDVDAHTRLDTPDKDGSDDYRRVTAPLVALQQAAPEVFYLYTLVPVAGGYVHGVDTATMYRVSGDTSERLALRQPYAVADADLDRAVATREAQVNAETWSEPGRRFLSAYAPFFGRAGEVAGVVEVDMWVRSLEARLDGLERVVEIALAGLVLLSVASGALLFRLRHAAATIDAHDRRTLAALGEARDAAEASSHARSEFLATMSHELRTPLNAIVGYSELLHEEFEALGDEGMRNDVHRIAAASRHLTAIIGDILDYTKLDGGQMVIAVTAVDVGELLDDLGELLRPGAVARGLTLDVRVHPAARVVWADPVRLRQVLLNLLGNALKFTEQGGVSVRVRPAPDRSGRVVCTVHDSGIGIPPEARGRLFQAFSQLQAAPARSAGGTGLGLIISRRLAEAMGGTLGFRSRVGHGSAFRLTVPVPPEAPARVA